MPIKADLQEFVYGQRKPIKQLSKAEALAELEVYRAMFNWLNEEVKYYLARLGMTIRIVRRDFKPFVGEFLSPRFTIKDIEVACFDKVFDQDTGKWVLERKVILIAVSNLIDFEFIMERLAVEPEGEETLDTQEPLLEEAQEIVAGKGGQ